LLTPSQALAASLVECHSQAAPAHLRWTEHLADQAAGASIVLLAHGGGEPATTGPAAAFPRGDGELESDHIGQGGAPWL